MTVGPSGVGEPKRGAPVEYPSSDGEPVADSTEQLDWMIDLKLALDRRFPDAFVGANLFWYPVEGRPDIRVAPDGLVAFGRPKGPRPSYKQWEEGGVPLHVVFEWWSPRNTFGDQVKKLAFYDRYGVDEFVLWDEVRSQLQVYVRGPHGLELVNPEGGWRSPRLGYTFEVVDGELRVTDPDGRPLRDALEVYAREEELAREVEVVRERAEAERTRAEAERDRAEQLAAKLRALGIDPDAP